MTQKFPASILRFINELNMFTLIVFSSRNKRRWEASCVQQINGSRMCEMGREKGAI